MSYSLNEIYDIELFKALNAEDERQENSLELIASENFVSRKILEAYTSTLTNKYAEGYPGKRYYGGCENADAVENLAIERTKKLFKAKYANVQPHSGAQANMAVFLAALKHSDTVLGMDLAHGGHLTHGSKVNFSGMNYNTVFYGVDKNTMRIDYNDIHKKAKEHQPELIIAGASAYPRTIDFAKFKEIADEVGAKLMVDMAHIAGLVATGHHPSPIPYADFVTSTTHKTLRGPRGGIILSGNTDYEKIINSKVFPGMQGGPLMHVIAAKAAALHEALDTSFHDYVEKILENAQALCEALLSRGLQLVSGGTDNHLILVNTFDAKEITGKQAQEVLESVGITCNKNALPFDKQKPMIASGIRLGTPALTTRGFKVEAFTTIGNIIADVLENPEDQKVLSDSKHKVSDLCKAHPMVRFRL